MRPVRVEGLFPTPVRSYPVILYMHLSLVRTPGCAVIDVYGVAGTYAWYSHGEIETMRSAASKQTLYLKPLPR